MSGQVKTNREKIIDPNPLLAKILEIKSLDVNDFAIQCGLIPDSFKKALKRKRLGKKIVDKIRDKMLVRPGYWKDGREPFFLEKPTLDIKTEQADILDNPLVKNFVEHINTQKQLIDVLKRENDDLRKQLGK